MKTQKEFTGNIRDLERTVEGLREEVQAHEYCMAHKLDFNNHSDYALAVTAIRQRTLGGGSDYEEDNDANSEHKMRSESGSPMWDESDRELLFSKAIAGDADSCYNQVEATEKLFVINEDLERLSRYGFFDKLGKGFKKIFDKTKSEAKDIFQVIKKATGSRRVIRNNAGATICVTGNKKDGASAYTYLRGRGSTSSAALYDADGVVILNGQTFYDSISAMKSEKKNRKYSSGVIKVGDAAFGVGQAEVVQVAGEANTFYVNARGTSHHSRSWAKGEHWALP